MRRIIIVGGGFSGAAAAVQLVRRSPLPLAITIVEARARVGGGLAYASDDQDHRINGQPQMHSLDPAEPGMFAAWCETHGTLMADPQARAANGSWFMRRSTFRRYLEDTVARHAAGTGSSITHKQDMAVDVLPGAAPLGDQLPTHAHFTVVTADGTQLPGDMVILACGHTRARLPPPIKAADTRIIVDPLAAAHLPAIPAHDRVLVLGSSLTAYDVVSTLLTAGHSGAIDVVSRRGLRPRPQRPPPAADAPPLAPMLERTSMRPEPFLLDGGPALTVRALLRALRAEIRRQADAGIAWDHAFDHLRDMASQLWPPLALAEKRRFMRRLRVWYDVHRFRVPPQNSAIVHAAELRGQVRFRAALVEGVASTAADAPLCVTLRPRDNTGAAAHQYERIINCTGVDAAPPHEVPLYAALMRRGLISADPSGVGLAVDAHCRARAGADAEAHAEAGVPAAPPPPPSTGRVSARLRIIGPPTAGARGDPLGSAFIAIQVYRALPDMLNTLAGPLR